MSSSNVIREAKKREKAQEQIDANLSLGVEEADKSGRKVALTKLFPMDSYSTKFMTPADQVVLAVDKVDAPEVKAGMIPQDSDTSQYVDGQSEVYDYATHLSLNDGDADAFRSLKFKMQAHPVRMYAFAELPDGTGMKEDDFVIAYMKQISATGIGFFFDLYDGGEVSGNEDVPSASASVELTKEADENGNPFIKWEYVIVMHSGENKKPKDTVVKAEYLKLQAFMRSIIVTLGILPSNL